MALTQSHTTNDAAAIQCIKICVIELLDYMEYILGSEREESQTTADIWLMVIITACIYAHG